MKRISLCFVLAIMSFSVARGHENQNFMINRTVARRERIILKRTSWTSGIRSLKPSAYSAYIQDQALFIFSEKGSYAQIVIKQSSGNIIYNNLVQFEVEKPIKIEIPFSTQTSYFIEIRDQQNGTYSGSFQM